VLNLTKDWQADWGGLLQFLGEDGKVVDTFFPSFNSLMLFQVPMWHHVSYVTPFAGHGRYAITGWGMSKPPKA
ncbi:MAG: 2OG-Fe(II) oxygenase family protein, partial [Gammaproteobacteria bacterium]